MKYIEYLSGETQRYYCLLNNITFGLVDIILDKLLEEIK